MVAGESYSMRIHMNGRVYDPNIGRFLSADPFVQAPFNSQSFNRYSYVWNNPLSLTDPSGFVIDLPDMTIVCDYCDAPSEEQVRRALMHFIWLTITSSQGSGPSYNASLGSEHTASDNNNNSQEVDTDISEEQLINTMLTLWEKGAFDTGVLSSIGQGVDAADLSYSLAATTITIGLRDIKFHRMTGIHQPSQAGSIVNWKSVDWNQYDTGSSAKNVMANYFNSQE